MGVPLAEFFEVLQDAVFVLRQHNNKGKQYEQKNARHDITAVNDLAADRAQH